MTRVRTCLWYENDGEAAADFYVSLLPDSRVEAIHRPAPDAPAVAINFTLAGVPYQALNGGIPMAHSSAASVSVTLDTQEEADTLYDALVGNGGAEIECGWVTDRWGIHWQVIPAGLPDALFSGTNDENARAYARMREMKRLSLADILAARHAN